MNKKESSQLLCALGNKDLDLIIDEYLEEKENHIEPLEGVDFSPGSTGLEN